MSTQNTHEDVMIATRHRSRSLFFVPVLAALLLLAAAPSAHAQQDYKTPQDAVDALVATAKSGDMKAALIVLGRDGEDIISSGDKVSDDAVRARFVESYEAKHEVKMNGDAKATLIIGTNDYPFPIPLARNKNSSWSFDSAAGREEILARRIGHNELDTIQTALAYVDAQDDYAEKDRGAGTGVYAQRFISDEGKKDGLYWPTTVGEEESPLGELFAAATRQGYKAGEGRAPYHGYYYKILTKQGPAAPGGSANYVVDGKMIGGFGLVAYPAEYRNSGVMTFIVNHSGTVYQKDLGPKTDQLAEAIAAFNPDKGWQKVDVPESAK
ncbi:MAG TPA: DUF2950 domain-containing protein [Xanthobacteraceae bacterium]|jgi:hypothetical protein|nr:DUF2950 domain-containing protein [Xanthobacteraceae bacterium]